MKNYPSLCLSARRAVVSFAFLLVLFAGGCGGSVNSITDTKRSTPESIAATGGDGSVQAPSPPGNLQVSALNDAGITVGGNDPSGNNADCSSNIDAKQDCHHGRDARAAAGILTKVGAGHGGFDFTKLDANGNILTNQNAKWSDGGSESSGTRWSCVKDNHTGLIWEVKTNDDDVKYS